MSKSATELHYRLVLHFGISDFSYQRDTGRFFNLCFSVLDMVWIPSNSSTISFCLHDRDSNVCSILKYVKIIFKMLPRYKECAKLLLKSFRLHVVCNRFAGLSKWCFGDLVCCSVLLLPTCLCTHPLVLRYLRLC